MAVYPAITIWQPWASLIMVGLKAYEFRRWPAPERLYGQRIAIHAGARKPTKMDQMELLYAIQGGALIGPLGRELTDSELKEVEAMIHQVLALPRSAVLGTVILGRPQKATKLFADDKDADRIDPRMWGWPLSDPRPLPYACPAKGAQGWWTWRPSEDCGAPRA